MRIYHKNREKSLMTICRFIVLYYQSTIQTYQITEIIITRQVQVFLISSKFLTTKRSLSQHSLHIPVQLATILLLKITSYISHKIGKYSPLSPVFFLYSMISKYSSIHFSLFYNWLNCVVIIFLFKTKQ